MDGLSNRGSTGAKITDPRKKAFPRNNDANFKRIIHLSSCRFVQHCPDSEIVLARQNVRSSQE